MVIKTSYYVKDNLLKSINKSVEIKYLANIILSHKVDYNEVNYEKRYTSRLQKNNNKMCLR